MPVAITPTQSILTATVLTGLFGKIDRSFSRDRLLDLFKVAGADESESSINLFNMLRRVVLGDTSPLVAPGEDADTAIAAALERVTGALNTRSFSGHIVSLVGQSVQQVTALAMSDIGVRFSLSNFVPFAIVGAPEIYAQHNRDDSLTRFDASTGTRLISDEWIADRSQYFAAR